LDTELVHQLPHKTFLYTILVHNQQAMKGSVVHGQCLQAPHMQFLKCGAAAEAVTDRAAVCKAAAQALAAT
jgi:hypothetical protein